MKLRPIEDRVIVKVAETLAVSKGGIALVAAVDKQVPVRGKVLAVGEGRLLDNGTLVPMDVQVGDVVVFEQSLGNEISERGEKLYVVREADILAVITE